MNVITLKPNQLAKALVSEGRRVRGALPKASRAAAQRLRARTIEEIDRRKITDRGILKNALRVVDTGRNEAGQFTGAANSTVSLLCDAPHAGIVELGARPHPVSAEGIAAIAAWCMRKLGKDEKDAMSMANAIAWKLRTEGQRPTYVFRYCVQFATRYFAEELARIIRSGPKAGAR